MLLMNSLLNNLQLALAKLVPIDDFLLPNRLVVARYLMICFIVGFVSAYLFNFLAKKALALFRKYWKARKRVGRLSQIKVPNGEFIGEVTSYLSKLKVAIIKIQNKQLVLGDTILINGKKTKLMVPVKSMQVNHKPVEVAKKGAEIGLLIGKPAFRHDLVFKLKKTASQP